MANHEFLVVFDVIEHEHAPLEIVSGSSVIRLAGVHSCLAQKSFDVVRIGDGVSDQPKTKEGITDDAVGIDLVFNIPFSFVE